MLHSENKIWLSRRFSQWGSDRNSYWTNAVYCLHRWFSVQCLKDIRDTWAADGRFLHTNGVVGQDIRENFRYQSSSLKFATKISQITRFTWPTWGPHGSCRPHVGPMDLSIRDRKDYVIHAPSTAATIKEAQRGNTLADHFPVILVQTCFVSFAQSLQALCRQGCEIITKLGLCIWEYLFKITYNYWLHKSVQDIPFGFNNISGSVWNFP